MTSIKPTYMNKKVNISQKLTVGLDQFHLEIIKDKNKINNKNSIVDTKNSKKALILSIIKY